MATASKAKEYFERGPDRRSGDDRREEPHAYKGEERRIGEDRREASAAPYTGPERRKHPRRVILDRRG